MSALSCPDGADDVAKSRIAATFGPVPTKSKAAVLLSEPHATADARRQLPKHAQRRTFFAVQTAAAFKRRVDNLPDNLPDNLHDMCRYRLLTIFSAEFRQLVSQVFHRPRS